MLRVGKADAGFSRISLVNFGLLGDDLDIMVAVHTKMRCLQEIT